VGGLSDDNGLDIKMTNTMSEDGKRVVPALVANIPIRKVKEGGANDRLLFIPGGR